MIFLNLRGKKMTDEEIIRELKNIEEQYRNKPVPTFEVNTSLMARSCRQHIEQLAKENAEQKAQIEKMKNVGNCKHAMECAKWNEKQCNLGLMRFCLNCKDWELAE